MSLDLTRLTATDGPARILLSVPLKPAQGRRFQPTGFPDLGAAVYDTADGSFLVVESHQSMANRLEATCWDPATKAPISALAGLSYIQVNRTDGSFLTSSMIESHRINSPYILEGKKDTSVLDALKHETASMAKGPVDLSLLAKVLLKYDANSLIHGVFLAKSELAGGRLRLPRALGAFIEAEGVRLAPGGGVKMDNVDPQGDTKKGFGHVPFQRDDYVADQITAYFSVDLSQLRGYGLGEEATALLIALALYKVRTFIDAPMRLRTFCDLVVAGEPEIDAPKDWTLPSQADLAVAVRQGIRDCAASFAGINGVTTVTYEV